MADFVTDVGVSRRPQTSKTSVAPRRRANFDIFVFLQISGTRGHLGAILGPSWGHLGVSWDHLGASWGIPGAFLGHLGAILRPLGVSSGPPWRAITTTCARDAHKGHGQRTTTIPVPGTQPPPATVYTTPDNPESFEYTYPFQLGILQGAAARGPLEGAPRRTPSVRKAGRNAYTHFAGGLRTHIAA